MKRKYAILGMVAGFALSLFGLVAIIIFAGGWYISVPAQFGADFYTYIDEAAAYTALNVARVGVLNSVCLGVLSICLGLGIASFFGMKLPDYPKEVKEKVEEIKEEISEEKEGTNAAIGEQVGKEPMEEFGENEYIVQPNNFDDEIE